VWLGLPVWYLQANYGLYHIGKGGWMGGRRIGVICPMLNNLAYESFKGIGSGGHCSEAYLVYEFW
jgi:hypothetical protein